MVINAFYISLGCIAHMEERGGVRSSHPSHVTVSTSQSLGYLPSQLQLAWVQKAKFSVTKRHLTYYQGLNIILVQSTISLQTKLYWSCTVNMSVGPEAPYNCLALCFVWKKKINKKIDLQEINGLCPSFQVLFSTTSPAPPVQRLIFSHFQSAVRRETLLTTWDS